MIPRFSVTDVDAWRYYVDSEDQDLSELLMRLRRQAPPTEAMEAGRALHKALETAVEGDFRELACDGYTFKFDAPIALDLASTRELKATKVYIVDRQPVEIVGVVDAIHGNRVEDHKSTTRFDPERFLSTYQWRFYLDIFGADRFRWNVFEWKESAPMTYAVFGFHQLEQCRYPGMRDDIDAELRGFLAFARQHLPERFATQEAA